MATVYKTPGVYIEEIPKFPPSIAQVETAIPAFIGYTEKASKDGASLFNKPLRISSLLEFTQYFGGPYASDEIDVTLDDSNNYAVSAITIPDGKRYFLYDSVRLYYDNGGGDCYIVSIGKYGLTPAIAVGDENNPTTSPGFRVGIAAIEKEDEPTLILFPDATLLPASNEIQFYSLQQMALAQCAKLQDRFTLMDLFERGGFSNAIKNFRDNIGINDLKYGAAYTPWLYTAFNKDVDYATFKTHLSDSGGPITNLMKFTTDPAINELITITEGSLGDITGVKAKIDAVCDAGDDGTIPATATLPLSAPTIKDRYKQLLERLRNATSGTDDTDRFKDLIRFVRNTALFAQNFKTALHGSNLLNDLNAYAQSESMWKGGVKALIGAEKNAQVATYTGVNAAAVDAEYATVDTTWLGGASSTIAANTANYNQGGALTAKALALAIEPDVKKALDKLSLFYDSVYNSAITYKNIAQQNLYDRHPVIGNIVLTIKKELSKLPPSGAIAGICARVDGQRGVWKAPANESIRSVIGPVTQITSEQQESINVDVVAGKSINAIRNFTGRGTLVWGGRTLAGNDNEWRYINVRRFFNMVEESTKNATLQFVFEPNDANTWVKVQAMIENFLITMWRQGALQGAKPEQAFYVAVGLGKTMTALDILEGRMIVEIGMAVVRPAEFIILRFSHKMVES